MIKLRSMLKS